MGKIFIFSANIRSMPHMQGLVYNIIKVKSDRRITFLKSFTRNISIS